MEKLTREQKEKVIYNLDMGNAFGLEEMKKYIKDDKRIEIALEIAYLIPENQDIIKLIRELCDIYINEIPTK